MGDPTAIPFLRSWLAEGTQLPFHTLFDSEKLMTAIRGLAAFRDQQSYDMMWRLHRNPHAPFRIRSEAAKAMAAAPNVADQDLQKLMWNLEISLEARSAAAVQLLRRGDETARMFLLLQYDLLRASHPYTSHYQPLLSALSRTADDRVVVELKQRLESEQNPVMQRNIKVLLDRIDVNFRTLEELRAMAADASGSRENIVRRLSALEALADRATADDIPLLKDLKPFENPVHERPDTLELQVRGLAEKIIGEIRRREWAEEQANAQKP
jgi:hypothetical protein